MFEIQWWLPLTLRINVKLLHVKKQRYYFADKGPSSQNYVFSSSHVWMWELAYRESWVLKNLWSWTVVLEKTLENPLDCKEIQPVHPKGDQSWIFIGRTDAEPETLVLWSPHAKNWLIGKDPDAGQDWRQEEKGTTEDEMVGWHHQLDRSDFERALGVGDGRGGLACCSLCGHKESLGMTESLNWAESSWAADTIGFLPASLTFLPHVQPCRWPLSLELGRPGPFSWPRHLWGLLECAFSWSLPGGFLPAVWVSAQTWTPKGDLLWPATPQLFCAHDPR